MSVYFQGATANMSSGTTLGVYAPIDRVSDVTFDFSFTRQNVNTLNRFKPADNRPILNYAPVTMTLNYVKGDKNVERCLGILNSTGIAVQIGQNSLVTNWGCRTYPIYISPASYPNNFGEFDIASGALKSFALQGSVNEPVHGSIKVEALDLQQVNNNNQRTIPSYSGQVIRPQDMILTGINFTGFGFSGIIIQSFNFTVNFEYAYTLLLGSQYPLRKLNGGGINLNIEGYMDGTTNPVATLSGYYPGQYVVGQYVFSLNPGCNPIDTPTVITLTNPYLESQSISTPVGDYIKVNMAFSVPLSPVASEASFGSNASIT